MPSIAPNLSVYAFAHTLQAFTGAKEWDALSVAQRSDRHGEPGQPFGRSERPDQWVSPSEMRDLFEANKAGGFGLTTAESRVARKVGVLAKAFEPAPSLPVSSVALNPLAAPAWRKTVALSSISGVVQAPMLGAPTEPFDAKALATRIAGPRATQISPGDFVRALPWLSGKEARAANVLFDRLYLSTPFVAAPQQAKTPGGRAFTVETLLTGRFSGSGAEFAAQRTASMPVPRGMVAVNLETGEVFRPVAGSLKIPLTHSPQSLALIRSLGAGQVAERFELKAVGELSVNSSV